jgi:hypothetical protein
MNTLAQDEDVRAAALEVFDALPWRLQLDVEAFLHGIYPGQKQPLERSTATLYRAYAPVRRIIGGKYGGRVCLYRGEPRTPPALRRDFLSWTPSRKMAARFAEERGFVIVSAYVDVNDIVAVLFSKQGGFYIEYLVCDRPEYHASQFSMPMAGVVFFDFPHGFSRRAVSVRARALRNAVRTVGGRVVRVRVDEDDETASATVLLPAEVVGDADEMTFGGFTIEGLRPVAR